jgi:hypothetical protein
MKIKPQARLSMGRGDPPLKMDFQWQVTYPILQTAIFSCEKRGAGTASAPINAVLAAPKNILCSSVDI